MQLQQAVNNVFVQLSGSLENLSGEDYVKPCKSLGEVSVGQHVRHIIEMFFCLENGYRSGIINYENRKRNKLFEQDSNLARLALQDIYSGLSKPDKSLMLEGVYNDDSSSIMQFPTNYYREIVYNLEHTIHHMALIRIALTELTHMELPENYGVASSTVKHKRSCAQ